jgi:hypothetical protein
VEGFAQRRPGGAQLGRGRVHRAESLGELEGAFGLGAVGQEAAGLPAQGWFSCPSTCSTARRAMTECCRTAMSSCSPPLPGAPSAQPPVSLQRGDGRVGLRPKGAQPAARVPSGAASCWLADDRGYRAAATVSLDPMAGLQAFELGAGDWERAAPCEQRAAVRWGVRLLGALLPPPSATQAADPSPLRDHDPDARVDESTSRQGRPWRSDHVLVVLGVERGSLLFAELAA